MNLFWGWCTHTGADLNITWIQYSWFLIKKLLKWHLRNTKGWVFFTHIPHLDGGLKISRACQSIPATYKNNGRQFIDSSDLETCNFFCWRYAQSVENDFPEIPLPSSALIFWSETANQRTPSTHGRHPDSSWDKHRTWRWLIEAAWDTVRLPVCFCCLIITLVFIAVFYMLCIDCVHLSHLTLLVIVTLFLNPVTTLRIRFVVKQTLHLKYPLCGQPVFTLPAANLISRLQTASLFLPPVMWYIITTYKETFMHEPFQWYLCQENLSSKCI